MKIGRKQLPRDAGNGQTFKFTTGRRPRNSGYQAWGGSTQSSTVVGRFRKREETHVVGKIKPERDAEQKTLWTWGLHVSQSEGKVWAQWAGWDGSMEKSVCWPSTACCSPSRWASQKIWENDWVSKEGSSGVRRMLNKEIGISKRNQKRNLGNE